MQVDVIKFTFSNGPPNGPLKASYKKRSLTYLTPNDSPKNKPNDNSTDPPPKKTQWTPTHYIPSKSMPVPRPLYKLPIYPK